MAKGIIVGRLINSALGASPGSSKREWGSRPWKVRIESWDGHGVGALYHYGTKMLEFTLEYPSTILGWWAGWGSVSDQQGVNAALSALGQSKMRYSRDRAGGGARVNPGGSYRISASVGRAASSISAITPPEY